MNTEEDDIRGWPEDELPLKDLRAEIIFNTHSWEAIGAISPSKDFCLKAMKEYAKEYATDQLQQRDETIKQITNGLIELRNRLNDYADEYKKEENASKFTAYQFAAKKINDLIQWHDLDKPVNF